MIPDANSSDSSDPQSSEPSDSSSDDSTTSDDESSDSSSDDSTTSDDESSDASSDDSTTSDDESSDASSDDSTSSDDESSDGSSDDSTSSDDESSDGSSDDSTSSDDESSDSSDSRSTQSPALIGFALTGAASDADSSLGQEVVGDPTVPCAGESGGAVPAQAGTQNGQLIVTVKKPGGFVPRAAVTATNSTAGFKKTVTADGSGVADFGTVPLGSYDISAINADFGAASPSGPVFKVGPATASTTVSVAPPPTKADVLMTTVEALTVENFAEDTGHPERIFKPSGGRRVTATDVVITAKVTALASIGPDTHVPVRLLWSFQADGTNAPDGNGGRAASEKHFQQARGESAIGGDGIATATTDTNSSGESKILFLASAIGGDKYTIQVSVLRDPDNTSGGALRTAKTKKLEVWKKVTFDGVMIMKDPPNPKNTGVDLTSLSEPATVQPFFNPGFTAYQRGPLKTIPFKRFISDLSPPSDSQLPVRVKIMLVSDGPDTRVVKIRGLKQEADKSVKDGTEDVRLNGTSNVQTNAQFQNITTVSVTTPSADRIVTILKDANSAIDFLSPSQTSKSIAAKDQLFDTEAAVNSKAKAWKEENEVKNRTDLQKFFSDLKSSGSITGSVLAGCAFGHPKLSGQPEATTNFYAGYPGVQIGDGRSRFHPDQPWGAETDAAELGGDAALFLNSNPSTRQATVVHEIGHASDHVPFAGSLAADHCPNKDCVMFESATKPNYCTKATNPQNDSVRRLMGWSGVLK